MDDVKLKIPEQRYQKKIEQESLAITLGLHLLGFLLLALFFATCGGPTDPEEELVEVTWGGGGGAPGVNEPVGPAQRGTPKPSAPKPQPRVTESQPNQPKIRQTAPSDEQISTRRNQPKRTETRSTPEKTNEKTQETSSNTNTEETSQNQDNSGPVGQNPQGTGTRPAGGSGGIGVGFSVGAGFGNRGWIRSPKATAPEGTSSEGTVVLQFTVMPNGDVTNIIPQQRANGDITNAAIGALRRAKARPLPSSADQMPKTYVITYRFVLK